MLSIRVSPKPLSTRCYLPGSVRSPCYLPGSVRSLLSTSVSPCNQGVVVAAPPPMLLLLLSSALLAMDVCEVVDKYGFRYRVAKSGAFRFARIVAKANKPTNWTRAVDPTHEAHHVRRTTRTEASSSRRPGLVTYTVRV